MSYKLMKHFSSLCVLRNPCYSRWCYDKILAIAPCADSQCMGENRRKTPSTILYTARWRGGMLSSYLQLIYSWGCEVIKL